MKGGVFLGEKPFSSVQLSGFPKMGCSFLEKG